MAKPPKFHIKEAEANETNDQRGRVVETLCEHYKPADMVASLPTYIYWTQDQGLSGDQFCCNCLSALPG